MADLPYGARNGMEKCPKNNKEGRMLNAAPSFRLGPKRNPAELLHMDSPPLAGGVRGGGLSSPVHAQKAGSSTGGEDENGRRAACRRIIPLTLWVVTICFVLISTGQASAQLNHAPGAFSLISPLDGATTTTDAGLGAAWQASIDPDEDLVTYTLEIRSGSDWPSGQTFYRREGIDENVFVVGSEAGFVDGESYLWQITAVDFYGAETPSNEIWGFEIDNTNPVIGWLKGTVYDTGSVQPIPQGELSASDLAFVTTGNGYYLGSGPSGSHLITVTAEGYYANDFSDVAVPNGGVATRNFGLDPLPFTVATPTFSPEPGTFLTLQHVTVSCATEDAIVYCTIDGADPTQSSPVCESPIEVKETTTIKAKACRDGWAPSEIATGAYTLNLQQGDINGDGVVDMADLILVLQSMTEDVPDATICMASDVNGDGKIDLADVAYILQELFVLR
jgi:hypothetical protein